MVKKSLIWLYAFTTYLLWLVIIVLACGVLGMRYLVLPNVQDYRDDITRIASEAVGQKVTIGKLEAGWDGLNPHFDLRQVTIHDQQQRPALQLDHIEASLSWVSLAVMEPRLDNLTIHEPRLTVRREKDGALFVAGISMSGPSRPAFPNWLLRQEEIVVRDASVIWQDDMRNTPPLSLEKLNLAVERPFSRSLMDYHRFGLTATPSVSQAQPLDIRGSVYGGDVSRLQKWHGTLYAATQGADIAAWRAWLPLPAEFLQGYGAMRMWVDFANGAVRKTTADVALSNVATLFNPDKPPLAMRSLTGHIGLEKKDNGGFVLTASKLSLTSDQGFNIRNGLVKLHRDTASAPISGDLTVDHLALEPLAALADYLPIGDGNRQKLLALAPAGSLSKLHMRWQTRNDKLEKYSLRAGFSGLELSPYGAFPGFTGISGEVDANEARGKLSLDARNARLNLPAVFRQPIPADTLRARIEWTVNQGVVDVDLPDITITNPHLQGLIQAKYRFDGIKGGHMDLTGNIRNADAKYAAFYYPKVLGEETLHWLDTSIFAGRSDDIKVRLKGHLDDFPYKGGKTGEFSVTASIRDAFVDYANDWPKISGLMLKMKFFENKMLLTEATGKTLGLQLNNTTIRINELDAEHPMLEIDGQAQGSLQEGLNFIEKSPIRNAIDHFTDGMKGTGNGKLALKLSIPVDNLDGSRFKGSYTVSNGVLEGDEDWPALDSINGRLDFTESSIKADKVQARVYGSPMVFSLASGANRRVDIRARGRLTHTALAQAIDHPLAAHWYGSAEWRGQITMQNRRSDFVVEFPDLIGLSSSLPYPLDKPSDTPSPLRIERRLTGDGDSIAMNYGAEDRAVSLRMSRSQHNGKLAADRADLRLGGEPHPASLARGFVIGGELARLDADQWLSMLNEARSGAAPADNMPAIQNARLKLGWLDAFGKRIHNAQLDIKPEGESWKANVKSREINGDITWLPQGHGHVIARLDTLIVPESAPPKLSESDEAAKPRDYPSISLSAGQFEARGKKLGKLDLRARQEGSHWNIEALRLENPDFVADATGVWRNWRGQANTQLDISLDVANLGRTLERFGHPGTVKDSAATLKGVLSWPGGPQAFAPEKLSGNFALNVTKGQFLKIQPGGVGRLLGLLSLQNLPRRLLLDFRDIFSSGFAYDSISGDVRITQGVMSSNNFVMNGASAKVEISGETDLARETQNLNVKVTPALSDSLSLAALAGGPAVAVGAFIAQKLLNDPLNKIASYEYTITGTWDDPQEVKKDSKQNAPAPSPLGK